MKIIIATGGTGGHIFTGMAIAEELTSMGIHVVFISSRVGLGNKIINGKYPIRFTWQKPLLGRGVKDKLSFPIFLIVSLLQSIYILAKEQPSGVVGTGGFSSFSIIFMARLLGIPTIITEIDSIPGLTTRILSRFVVEIWLAFESAKRRLPARKAKVCGFPIRKGITSTTKTINDFGLSRQKPTVLVFGGSRGAYKINQILKATIPLLPELQFIWQTGNKIEATGNEMEKLSNVWVSEFIEDMGSAYGNADLVVARAGALTIGEIAKVGLPAILIPYPYAAGGHQLMNAKILEKNGAARVILEKDLTPQLLAVEIKRIIENEEVRKKMKSAIKRFNRNEAANLIAKRIISLCSGT